MGDQRKGVTPRSQGSRGLRHCWKIPKSPPQPPWEPNARLRGRGRGRSLADRTRDLGLSRTSPPLPLSCFTEGPCGLPRPSVPLPTHFPGPFILSQPCTCLGDTRRTQTRAAHRILRWSGEVGPATRSQSQETRHCGGQAHVLLTLSGQGIGARTVPGGSSGEAAPA